ncbi:37878_t:CDS:2 [Gigaspora margarita]|uniref:37878_t:CDS:1 n=1 Tax=Gigaspora margarita TaxID=4874 RepID=A0ABN7UZP5_GIGMA|nr:37878_t:CDS:2 [Gigaspora margarita]
MSISTPELATMIHTTVNFDDNLFKKIFDANNLSLATNNLKIRCDDKPKFEKYYQHKDDTSEPTYFIGL